MAKRQDCPGSEYWQSVADGTAPADMLERSERHLSSCAVCQARLDQAVARETDFLQLGRQYGDPTEVPADPTLLQMVEQLADAAALAPATRPGPVDLYFLRPADRAGLLGLLGDYEVQEVIGQGGMGMVLKAYEPALQRLVAIKVLSPALAGSATARRRFTREAQAAAAVCHENIVPVYGVHETDGLPYLVMQYVAGESLQDRLDRLGPLDTAELVRIGYQTACGLAAAHAQGLIHRDIKPANLMLENRLARVKITDFGLARMRDDVQLTQAGVIAGTPEYMSPEQARAEAVDHRADLFSLGSVLYAMGTGMPPFRGASAVALLRKVSDQDPPPVRRLNPEVPEWLAQLTSQLLAKDPARRLQSAAEVADLLQGYLAHLCQPEVPPPQLPAPVANAQGDRGMIVFACSACGKKVKTRPDQAGKKVKCPHCAQSISVPDATPARSHGRSSLLIALAAFVLFGLTVAALCVRFFVRDTSSDASAPAASFLEVRLGHRAIAGVEDSGFYNDEQNEWGTFRWTDGNARLVIPLARDDQPRALLLQLQRPKKSWLKIKVNDREVLSEPGSDAWEEHWERTVDLGGIELGDKLVLELQSSTVKPQGDSREIGVKVSAIKLLRTPAVKPSSFLQDTLAAVGNRPVPGVQESGFYGEERNQHGMLVRWTDGHAKLVIPLKDNERPQALLVQLGRPDNTFLRILVNQRELLHIPPRKGRPWKWETTFDLTSIDLGREMALEIISDPVKKEGERRLIGVLVRSVKLLRNYVAHLGVREVPGVAESGFYGAERMLDQPCRWTNGAAKLTIPLRGQTPRFLALTAWVPDMPNYRIRVKVNGTTLFDEVAKVPRPSGMWECELPLAGVPLGETATIEIESTTFVPAEIERRSKDDRKLGIRLRRVSLLAESESAPQDTK